MFLKPFAPFLGSHKEMVLYMKRRRRPFGLEAELEVVLSQNSNLKSQNCEVLS